MYSDQAVEIIKKNGKKMTADQLMTIGRQVNNTGRVKYFAREKDYHSMDGRKFDYIPYDASNGECEAWLPIVKTGKLSADQLMEAGKTAHDSDVWREIVSQGKLLAEQLLQAGISAHDFDVWRQVIASGKLSIEQLLNVGLYDSLKNPFFVRCSDRPNPWRLWYEIIQTGMLSAEQLMDVGRQLKDNWGWRIIVKTGKLSADQLMAAGQEVIKTGDDEREMYDNPKTRGQKLQSWQVWMAIIKTSELSADQLMIAGKEAAHKDVWIEIVRTGRLSHQQLKQVSELAEAFGIYTTNIQWAVENQIDWKAITTNDQLIEVGLAVECWTIWSRVADKLDWSGLSEEQILEIGFKADNSRVWGKVNAKINWEKKSVNKLLELGRRANYDWTWFRIIETGKLTAEQLMTAGSDANSCEVWRHIAETEKLSRKQLEQAAKQLKDRWFWDWLIVNKRVTLTGLSVDELLELGSLLNSERYWQMINEAIGKKS
ncbi:MAG: hypothetical protein WC473_01360 [Patescibacteria group bacterium]